MNARFLQINPQKILSHFFVILSLYKTVKVCYTVHMSIFTYFKEKRARKEEQALYFARIKQMGLRFPLFCKIHGVKAPDRQGALAQSREGDLLQLVHAPLDLYPNQVYVYSIPLNRVIGYLEEELSEKLVFAFGHGFCRDGEVEQILGGPPYKYFGCKIRIMETQEYMQEYNDFSTLYGE